MAKKKKLATPDWILEGFDSEEDYNSSKGMKSEVKGEPVKKKSKKSISKKGKDKAFKVRLCPECGSDEVSVVIGQDTKDLWECKKCKWKGKDIVRKELSEDEFMKYLDDKGEKCC